MKLSNRINFVLLWVVVFFLGFGFLLNWQYGRIQSNRYIMRFLDQQQSLIQQDTAEITSSILLRQDLALKMYLNRIKTRDSLKDISLINEAEYTNDLNNRTCQKFHNSNSFCYVKNNGVCSIYIKLVYGSENLGILKKQINISNSGLFLQSEMYKIVLLLICFSISIFIIMSWSLRWAVVNPLQIITNGIQPLKNGDFSINIPKQNTNEFALLRQDIYQITQKLHKYQLEAERNAGLVAIGSSTAMVAHDVRRPLASVKALLNVLPSIQNDPERVKKMAAEIDRVITSTNSLLNDIMDFSRDSTVLNLDDHGPDSVIIAAIGEALRSHPEAEVKLEYEFGHETKPMHADSQRMIRVLTNIIGNALEAMIDKSTGKACGNLFFKTYLAKRDGKDFVGISVADDGPGIPAEALSKLFDPFFTQGKKGGTGLGLAICQKVIDMHGGKIWAKNRNDTGGGAVFSLEVPAGEGRCGVNYADIIDHSGELRLFREEEAKREDIGDTASTAEFMRINKARSRISTLLIVDDEPLFRETVRSTLATLSQVKDYVKVIEVDSAETGLKVFEAREFDYVIADIDLGRGKMNGYTFAQKILQEHSSAYVLIHSNKRKVELDEKVRVVSAARFMGFLPKPMKPSELLQFLACKSFETGHSERSVGEAKNPACAIESTGSFGQRPQDDRNLKTALLLNDDEGLLMCFGDDLKKLGYQVLDAKNVSGAMEYFINRKIDMIVSDINLGDCEPTGYDFLTKVREKDPKVPFVFTSGYNRRDEWHKAQAAGATEYLQIPYELDELRKALGV